MSRRASRFVTVKRAARLLKTDFEHVMDLYTRYRMPKRFDSVHGLKLQVRALREAMEEDARFRLDLRPTGTRPRLIRPGVDVAVDVVDAHVYGSWR